MNLSDTFRCEHYRCVMAFRTCLQRQTARVTTPNSGKRRVPMHLAWCGRGKCSQGAEIRKLFAGIDVPEPELPKIRQQLAAKMRKAKRTYAMKFGPAGKEKVR